MTASTPDEALRDQIAKEAARLAQLETELSDAKSRLSELQSRLPAAGPLLLAKAPSVPEKVALYPGKSDVRIYDYVDVHVPMLARMFEKRRKGYKAIGYQEAKLQDQRLDPRELTLEYDQEAISAPEDLF